MLRLKFPANAPAQTCLTILSLLLSGCGWSPFGSKEEYLRRGREFAQKGKLDDAAFQYRKALQKDGNSGQAYLLYGQLLARQGQSVAAINCFSRAVQLMPNSTEAKAELGQAAVSELLKDPKRPAALHDSASKMATAILAADPKSFEGLRLMGFLAVADSNSTEAIGYFRRALAANPNEPEIVTILTQLLLAGNQGREAETIAGKALERFPHYGPLYDILYGYYMSSGNPEEGERLLRSKIANNPKNSFFVIELAGHFKRQKNIPQMEKALNGLLADLPGHPDAPLQVGDFYRDAGNLERAVASYQAGLNSERKKDCLARIAGTRVAQGRTAEAATILDSLLKQYPSDANALATRADLRMATGKPEEMRKAVEELATLVKKQPENLEIHYSLGRAYRQVGQDPEAQTAFREILQRDTKNRAALRELADLAIRGQKADEALRFAERLLELDPDNTGARLVRTSAWALKGRYAEVRAELRRITSENPVPTEAWLQMAALDIDTKSYAEAERILERLNQNGKGDFRSAKGLVMLYMVQKQPKKALLVAQAQTGRANTTEARILLASTAAQAGDLDLALSTGQKLSSDFPNDPDHLIFVGEILKSMGQWDRALAAFRAAQAKAPDSLVAGQHLADALSQSGRFDEAVDVCRGNLKIRPQDPLVINSLAWNLALAGKHLDEAASLEQRALQAEPGNNSFLDTSGMIDLKSGNIDQALRIFQQVVLREPHRPAFRTHLAEVLIAKGDPAKARAELEKALQDRPSAIETEQIKKLLKSAA